MSWTGKCNSRIFLVGVLAIFLTIPGVGFSQVHFKGKVIYEADEQPAAYATIELMYQKEGSLSDMAGNFSFYVSTVNNNDTLRISSVGYESLKIPVSLALKRSEFKLIEKTESLETVTVKAFSSNEVLGSKTESVGYYRSWNHKSTGGEIGRMLKVPYKEYKIDKIRFKVSNLCDTCLLRLHMRNVADGQPAEEILKDSVTVTISKLNLDDKAPEFDISAYDFTFTQSEIFVSIEVLNCKTKNAEFCSFSFAGTEKGEYLYKSRSREEWERTNDYTIHLKLFLRY